MAVNEKATYASTWTTAEGKIFTPGDRMDGRVSDHTLRNAHEQGLATGSHAEAERAKSAEQERRRDVEQQIMSRSEKLEHDARGNRRG